MDGQGQAGLIDDYRICLTSKQTQVFGMAQLVPKQIYYVVLTCLHTEPLNNFAKGKQEKGSHLGGGHVTKEMLGEIDVGVAQRMAPKLVP